MNKLRSDSAWNKLTPEQRETLEGWLFEQNLGYEEILGRVEKEFGLQSSVSALRRYYDRAAEERAQAELLDVTRIAKELKETPHDGDNLQEIAMTLLVKRMIQVAVLQPEKVNLLASLSRAVAAHRAVEVKHGWLELELNKNWQEMHLEERKLKQEEASAQLQEKHIAELRASRAALEEAKMTLRTNDESDQ